MWTIRWEYYIFKFNKEVIIIPKKTLDKNKDRISAVTVRSGESLAHLSTILNMDSYYLKKINAHLRNGRVPDRQGYKVNIPTSKVRMFHARYTEVTRPNKYKYAQR